MKDKTSEGEKLQERLSSAQQQLSDARGEAAEAKGKLREAERVIEEAAGKEKAATEEGKKKVMRRKLEHSI